MLFFLKLFVLYIFMPYLLMSPKTDLQTAIKTLLKRGPGLQDAKQSQFIAFRR